MDKFNAWEIQIVSDQRVINATSISTTGNMLSVTGGIAFETRNCVNGSGTGCCRTNTCSPLDGPGIADSAFADTKFTSGSGLLFNVTFQVVSISNYSPILIENDGFSNGTATPVVHTTTSASYGISKDFTLLSNPNSLYAFNGSSTTSNITLTSYRNFSGTVDLQASQSKGITASLSSAQTLLSANGTAVTKLIIQAENNASATSYTITVTATSSSLPANAFPHTVQVTITVRPRPYFVAYASPSLLYTHQSSGNSSVIIIQSRGNFTGTVNLQVATPASMTTASIDKSVLIVPNGGTANATLSITTQSSDIPFDDYFFVNATSGSLSQMVEVEARPPPGHFDISTSSSSITVQAGNSGVVTVSVTSQDYFSGTVYVIANSKTGLGVSVDSGGAFLNFSKTISFEIRVSTEPSTSVESHVVDLTVYGQLIGKAGQGLQPELQSTNVTIVVSAPPPTPLQAAKFLGLQEPEFFGIIGGLAIVLAVLGVFEARRSTRPKNRPILEG